MSREFAIETEGLTKRYGDETAIEDLSISVPSGAVFGFLGPNGAGKTTTIKILTTLLEPTGGTATVGGHSVRDRDAVRERIGYLPESPPVYEELSAREQLSYAAGLRDIPEETARRRIETWLERFDLLADADRRIGSYSKGMRQKVGLIQAVIHDPEVVILDEPTSGLDPRAARTVRDIIADLAAGDTTVFLSTHVLPVVDELADAVGVLSDGSLVAAGPPSELKRRAEDGEASLEDVFLEVTEQSDRGGTESAPEARGS